MGRGKKGSEAPAFFLFPSSPARLLFFSMIVPFFFVGGIGGGGGGGVPSGILCGGEKLTIYRLNVFTLYIFSD